MAVRAPLSFLSSLTGGAGSVRMPLGALQIVTSGDGTLVAVRAPLDVLQPVTGGDLANTHVRTPLVILQAVVPEPPELIVTTSLFPTLLGIKFSVKKNPEFNSVIRTNASGKEIATAFMQYPWWHFEFQTDYLPDTTPGSSGYTDMRTLQGFFLQMQGSYGQFLYHDPDDYHVVGGAIATADGVTLQWPLYRNFGGFSEPVGQVDLSTLFTFATTAVSTGAGTITLPAHGLVTGQYPPMFIASTGTVPGGTAVSTPYWPIVVDANTIKLASSEANALSNTPITISSVGSGTLSLTKGYAIYDNGTIVNPGSVSITLPNQIVFTVAPTSGHAITADFDFYFACRFEDNVTDFDHFAWQLWNLGKMRFKSIIQ